MDFHQNKGVSVFFPAFNDAPTIGDLVHRASETLKALTTDFEIIVVDDGSRDATAEKLADLQRSIPALRVVTHDTNRGYGAALRSGIGAAQKEFVFYTDGDGQYDVREMEKLFHALRDDVDVVNGYKLNRADGVHRKLFGEMYARATRKLFALPIRDVDCDFRLMRKTILDSIDLRSSSGAICVELVSGMAKRGAQFAEIGVNHYPRESGRSQFFKLPRIVATLVELGGLWLRRSRETVINRSPVTHQ
jgi:glycosyltransferase involved in cell wall biosynthesis